MRRLFMALAGLFLSGCATPATVLEKVKHQGELVVITRTGPTTYYQGPDGPTGFEYDLASRFAEHLGVSLRIVTGKSYDEIVLMLRRGEGDIAAAGLTALETRAEQVRFGPPYQEITQQLVYRAAKPQPKKVSDLAGGLLEVVAGSSHVARLKELQEETPELTWQESLELDRDQLLYLVWEGVIDYTLADSNEVALTQRFFPELQVAFDISKPQQLAWAFPLGTDNSLYQEAETFFQKLQKSGELAQLIDRYYGHNDDFGYVDHRTYLTHIAQRLPSYQAIFEAAALEVELDWRLLAAVGYQESHWNPKAVSPTGVRGIMMLTKGTAAQLGVKDRTDPEQSILGGARYLDLLKKKIPERITEPDRTWFALAAYNVGLGHLEDARILTQKLGGDPDKWVEVKKHLPLLSQEKWYSQTRNGYARGGEPVRFVENVRNYYDVLIGLSEREKIEQPSPFRLTITAATLSAM